MSELPEDELSIDSNTDKKIHIKTGADSHRTETVSSGAYSTKTSAAANKPHFRIDWRQLTYYKKERRSLCGRRSGAKQRASCAGDNNDDDHDGAEVCSSAGQSYLETGRLSRASNESSASSHSRRRPILNSLDGCFKSGELSAILGPSGAGKSTFLSALFGNKQESSYGQTRVTWFPPPDTDGARAGEDHSKRSVRIAILPQQDHLLNHLTVYETLLFASKIKNPHKAHCKSFHRANVRRVAETLKLTECLQTRCGRLSGGQYKRVSIGQELLSEPDVIILDEPTSGLDAMTCLTTVRTLKSIASKHPISIILTIHQPDIDVFNLFDKVYVIAQGGLAIYEGPPSGVVPTLAQVGLFMPSDNYNPARFIVENAFVATESETGSLADQSEEGPMEASVKDEVTSFRDDEEDEEEFGRRKHDTAAGFLRQSLSSITGALSGQSLKPDPNLALGKGIERRFRDSGRQPLLNIGIQTADGKLITSEQLVSSATGPPSQLGALESEARRRTLERLRVLRRLSELQKERYYNGTGTLTDGSFISSDVMSQRTSLSLNEHHNEHHHAETTSSGTAAGRLSIDESSVTGPASPGASSSSSGWAEARDNLEPATEAGNGGRFILSVPSKQATFSEKSAPAPADSGCSQTATSDGQSIQMDELQHRLVVAGLGQTGSESYTTTKGSAKACNKLRRQFDKRLSAKRSQAKRGDHPVWYHSFLLTHRTWLSIVRDPVFFGIQFAMHTTIPILLALIFGSQQEEGCPRVGNFDLVEFAYADERSDFLQGTMRSIRKSIGNIGVVFFEMFVLIFAINCITALVFPLDMYVLLKEHRNGWYSMRSYFFGRTLADLPVPVVLHSLAMCILCYMTGQPLSWARFSAVIALVILASLVAQSVGLTIGAVLMRSSQSAVLAAAGIVAPFFALSGFIVRIHTLPWLAQWAAEGSFLYHLLNGFIVVRYGFGRCPCDQQDFDQEAAHQIPSNIKTMASMWVGTYSNEFESSPQMLLLRQQQQNRTNLDPNIDIIDKLMGAFKMANSFGHKVDNCNDVLPYPMLDFNLRDEDIWRSVLSLVLMLLVTRCITFSAIYYKIRAYS